MTENETTRRNVLAGVAAAGLAVPVLAACGSSDSDGDPSADATGNGATDTPTAGASTPAGGSSIKTSDVPVGGGAVFPDEQIVVTQPTAGEFKAFTATCTHQGCLVNRVANGVIKCPCHGSEFAIGDGSVAHGPASRPLKEYQVQVKNGGIVIS